MVFDFFVVKRMSDKMGEVSSVKIALKILAGYEIS